MPGTADFDMVQDERRQLERHHVLAVNGDPPFLDFVRELLREECCHVTTPNSVPSFFTLIAAAQSSLLIVDLVVFREAGWRLLERLKAEAATTTIPILIASATRDLLARILADPDRSGGQAFIAKPFDLADLLEAVNQLIGSA